MFKKKKNNHIDLKKVYHSFEKVTDKIPAVKKKRRLNQILKLIKYLIYVIVIVFVITIFTLLYFLRDFKTAYDDVMSGKYYLELAVEQLKKKDFYQAFDSANLAESNFSNAYSGLEDIKSNIIIANSPFVKRQINDLEYLVNTIEILSKATVQSSAIGRELDRVLEGKISKNFSSLGSEEKRRVLKLLYESGPELNGIRANLELAYLNIEKVRPVGILWPVKSKIEELKEQLKLGKEIVAKTIPMSEVLPYLAGYPEKGTFLVLFQNSNELRPSGGFIGNYGILEIENGDIIRLETHDIYHMDMPVKDILKVEPPVPIKKYLVDQWFMRDANWSPDFPTAARQVLWFFYEEDKLLSPKDQINNLSDSFDGVIAIQPSFVTSLLSIVGPIEARGEIYTKDNFTELLEYEVQIDYGSEGLASWDRKTVIGEIMKELKARLFDLPSDRWFELAQTLREQTIEKNILVYFENEHLEEVSRELEWTGEVKNKESDYLMVVDANMAAFKTDSVMNKSIEYNIEQKDDGLYAKLKINYSNNGAYNWRTTKYRTYTRVFVPEGSDLIRVSGITDGEVEVAQELGKTYFGGFIDIEPGKIGSLYYEYRLPDRIIDQVNNSKKYSLYIQKQPGNNVSDLDVDFLFNNKVKSYSPTGFYVVRKENTVSWDSDLSTDKEFEVNFD